MRSRSKRRLFVVLFLNGFSLEPFKVCMVARYPNEALRKALRKNPGQILMGYYEAGQDGVPIVEEEIAFSM